MINYFIRPGGAYVKINTDTQIVSLILNVPTQKTLSAIVDNAEYYNNTVSASATWTITDQATYDTNKTEVSNYLNSL